MFYEKALDVLIPQGQFPAVCGEQKETIV